jgi:hypothetical protein
MNLWSDEAQARRRLAPAAAPFRRPDGSYRLKNEFRYAVATPRPSERPTRAGS